MGPFLDPASCPVCGSALSAQLTCPSCRLLLGHPRVRALGAVLHRADQERAALLTDPTAFADGGAALASRTSAPQPTPVSLPPATSLPAAGGGTPPFLSGRGDPVDPAPRPAGHTGRRLLLGAGALCLVVASSLFVVLAWLVLGWQVRLLLMLGLVAAALALAGLLDRRRLVGSAETMGALAVGFFAVAWGLVVIHLPGEYVLDVGLGLVAGAGVAVLADGRRRRWTSADLAAAAGLSGLGLRLLGHARPTSVGGAVLLLLAPLLVLAVTRRPALLRRAPVTLAAGTATLAGATCWLTLRGAQAAARHDAPLETLLASWALPWTAAMLLATGLLLHRASCRRATPVPGPWALLLTSAAVLLLGWWLEGGIARLAPSWSPWVSLAVTAGAALAALRLLARHGEAGWSWARPVAPVLPGVAVTAIPLVSALVTAAGRAAASQALPETSWPWLWPVTAAAAAGVVVVAGGRARAPRRALQGVGAVVAALLVPWLAHAGAWSPWSCTLVPAGVGLLVVTVDAAPRRPLGWSWWSLPWWSTALLASLDDLGRLAAALAVATLAAAVRAVRAHDRGWGRAGTALAVATVWCLLLRAHVDLLEAYTAAAAVGLGAWAWREVATVRTPSLPALPALVVALAPSVLVTLADLRSTRGLVVLLAAVALLGTGVVRQRAAHAWVGAVATTVLALWHVAPVVGHLPPWLPLGVGGVVLVGLGITWEARLSELRHLRGAARVLR